MARMPSKRYVILSDIQGDFHDPLALGAALDFTKEYKPDGIILNGDIVDCPTLSEFDRNPDDVKGALFREIRFGHKLMEKLEWVESKWWIEGNHEDRVRRLAWKRGLGAAVNFPSLFGLGTHGFQHHPYGGHIDLGKLMVTHGSMICKYAGATALAHIIKYGVSVVIGHTHRLAKVHHTDRNGPHVGIENGCLCMLNPTWVQHPDWQQGFSVVTVRPDGGFHPDIIPIIKRRSIYYGG